MFWIYSHGIHIYCIYKHTFQRYETTFGLSWTETFAARAASSHCVPLSAWHCKVPTIFLECGVFPAAIYVCMIFMHVSIYANICPSKRWWSCTKQPNIKKQFCLHGNWIKMFHDPDIQNQDRIINKWPIHPGDLLCMHHHPSWLFVLANWTP